MTDEEPPEAAQPPDLAGLAEQLAQELYSPKLLERLETLIGNAVARGVTAAGGAAVAAAKDIPDLLQRILGPLEDALDAVFAPFLATLVGHMLGVDVPASALRGTSERPGESKTGDAIARTF